MFKNYNFRVSGSVATLVRSLDTYRDRFECVTLPFQCGHTGTHPNIQDDVGINVTSSWSECVVFAVKLKNVYEHTNYVYTYSNF